MGQTLSGPIRTISAASAATNQFMVFVSVDPVPGPVALGVRLVTTPGVGYDTVQVEFTDLPDAVEETCYAPPLRIYSSSDTQSDDTASTGAEAGHALLKKVNGTAPIPLGPLVAVPVVNAIGAVAPERIGLAPVEKVDL